MDWHQQHEKPDGPSRQFSLRALFGLMCAVAILMGVAAISRDSRYFHALFSPHTLLAAIPIFGVVAVYITGIVSARRLAFFSVAIYGLALALPALRLASDLIMGWAALLLSFFGIGLFWDWGSRGEQFWYPIARAMGAMANLSFLIAYSAYLIFVSWGEGLRFPFWTATLGCCLSLLVIVPLGLSSELDGIYIGHGLWVSSFLALALGCWREP